MATAKRKVTSKSTKTKTTKTKKKSGVAYESYAVEHDFIIISGGALLVMVLVTLFVLGIF